MKVVIDIDEEDYEVIKEVDELGGSWKTDIASQTMKAVANGTPQYTDAEIQKMQDLEQAEIKKAYELGKADALDKIRADVINIADGKQGIKVRSVLRIIDKYKAESEG